MLFSLSRITCAFVGCDANHQWSSLEKQENNKFLLEKMSVYMKVDEFLEGCAHLSAKVHPSYILIPRDAQRDENKQAINAPLQRKEGKRAAYRDIHRYKGSAKQHMVGERNEQAALILAYAAGRRPKPKEEAKVAGSPWVVTTRGEEVARRALRAKRSSQLSRQCARCDRVRTCELRVTERSSVSLAPIVTETVSLRTTLSHLRRI